jgi:uncharacterized protein YbjT (DUF2867 family)
MNTESTNSQDRPPIVVIGATRGTGLIVSRELIRTGRPLRVVARNLAKARALLDDGISVFEADLGAPSAARDSALQEALRGAAGIIFTAAVPPGPAREATLKAVDYGGVAATIAAAHRVGFTGRFVYLTTMGVHHRNWLIRILDTLKWNILHWRAEAERSLSASGLDVVIVRAGILTDGPGGANLNISQGDQPMKPSTKIARTDVAQVLLNASEEQNPNRDFSVFAKHQK